jgi:TIR domain/Pentapeptide repeats (8 copies)
MANKKHLKILKQGAEAWNNWRAENPDVEPELREADLCSAKLGGANLSAADLGDARLGGANLSGTKLGGANLSTADLRRAYLHEANLSSANLSGANLSEAYLREANLSGTDLSRTDLREANLVQARIFGTNLREANLSAADLSAANLSGANLSGADLTKAIVGFTIFADLDLSSVKGIETIKHGGPSPIGIDTIYLSKGKIPGQFLRGAGVPDNFIEYMSSLVGTAFEYYSCFISYSSKDEEFAQRIFADLQQQGVRCWFAPHHVQAGKKLREQIDVAIRLHEKLLLILSPDSINSEWVKTEIARARKREVAEDKKVLFPVRLNISYEQLQDWECFDADRGKDSAREIREYYIPDFTKWKDHDQYQEEFKKLVRDLKKETRAQLGHD